MSRRDHFVAAAFAAHGIGREECDGSAQRGRSVTYDCLIMFAFSALTPYTGRQE